MTIEEILHNFGRSPKIVTLTTKTYPRMLKKSRVSGQSCPYNGVYRICRRNGIIGCSYENAVNNQRLREEQPLNREGDVIYFSAEKLWNGKGKHEGPYMVRHTDTDTKYIVFKPTQRKDGSLVNNADVWKDETGTVLNPSELADWLPIQSESKRQMVDKPVAWRTIELSNILAVTHGEEMVCN